MKYPSDFATRQAGRDQVTDVRPDVNPGTCGQALETGGRADSFGAHGWAPQWAARIGTYLCARSEPQLDIACMSNRGLKVIAGAGPPAVAGGG
ncbi:hypothetical protein PCANC_26763 [Puccinia coronata f. sp. avenae]|uniref:Uncharacterized protein n=1 Tax=Puccinia coronata f. sp. avenae TaxID=200324 RepID=A0A2N5TLS8_9BASI|nr:hypothetical protein PCANC_26763 [Puccinia coronata f. sp. avenae]